MGRYIQLGMLSRALAEGTDCRYAVVCDMCKAAYVNDVVGLASNPLCPVCNVSTLRFVSLEDFKELVAEKV